MEIRKILRQLLIFFGLVNLLGIIFYSWLVRLGIDPDVFLVINLFVCMLTLISLWMLYRGMRSSSTASFMASVYGSFLMKLVVAAIAVVIYAQLSPDSLNTSSVFGGMLLYFVYTFIEVKGLLELNAKK